MLFNGLLIGVVVIATIFLLRFYRFTVLYEDNINKCLDILNISYGRVAQLLDRPLLIDTPEVRHIMNELHAAQSAIHAVASEISKVSDGDEENSKEEEEDTD